MEVGGGGGRGGRMVIFSAVDSGSSGWDLNSDCGHCVMFLGMALTSHSAALLPGLQLNGYRRIKCWKEGR